MMVLNGFFSKFSPYVILQNEILWNGSEEMMVLTPAEVGLMTGSAVTHHPTLGGTVLERVKGKDYKVKNAPMLFLLFIEQQIWNWC